MSGESSLDYLPTYGIGTLGAVPIEGVVGGVAMSVDTELPVAVALSDSLANPTAPAVGAYMLGWDNVTGAWKRVWLDPSGAQSVITRRRSIVIASQGIDPAANTGGTITLAAAGAGVFHFITRIRMVRVATAALVGGALLTVTTTNLNGVQWRVGNAMAAGGTQIDMDTEFEYPLHSVTANTATTLVFPAPGAAVAWSCVVWYFTSIATA